MVQRAAELDRRAAGMNELPPRDKLLKLATAVAGCPHLGLCRAEFDAKGRMPTPLPSPDFVGRRYDGLVIIGANPGVAHSGAHEINDARMFELQERIKQGDADAFEELMIHLPMSMEKWPQMVNADGRQRMNYDIEEVAYVDIVKCATSPGGSNPRSLFRKTGILDRCWAEHTKPLLDLLQPTHIVALWKPIERVLEKLGYDRRGAVFGHYNGSHRLTREARYAPAEHVFEAYGCRLRRDART